MRFFVVLLFFTSLVFSLQNLRPEYKMIASGSVQDMVLSKQNIYVATDAGKVDIFDLQTKIKKDSIELPKIKDFMGDEVASKIYSVDYFNDKLLITSQGRSGYRQLWIYSNKKLKNIIDKSSYLLINEARWIDKDLAIFGLMSNEIILYNIKDKKIIYQFQVSSSPFSDLAISEDKKTFITTEESGIVRKYKTKTAQFLGKVGAKNLDKVFSLDYKKGVVLTAGQDRKSVVYKSNNNYEFEFDFLLYSCGLSPNAKLGAIAYNENNDILVFDIDTQKKLYNLHGQDSTLTKILFINDKELLSSSDSKTINYWRLR